MAHKARVAFIGTPKGLNWYFTLWSDAMREPHLYAVRRYSSFDNPFIDKDEIEKTVREMSLFSEALVRQEIHGEFVSSDVKVFKEIEKCLRQPDTLIDDRDTDEFTLGIDTALLRDDTVVVVANKTKRHISHIELMNNVEWDMQKHRIHEIWEQYRNVTDVLMDCTRESLFADSLETVYGIPITRIRINQNNKAEMIGKCSDMVLNGKIFIPENAMGNVLVQQMNTFENSFTKFGNVRQRAKGRNRDDAVIAFALSLYPWDTGLIESYDKADFVYDAGDGY
jgi:hypothetical protein